MNKSITQATQNDKQISKSIKRFFTRFHIFSALKASNAYKKKGIPVTEIFQYLFLLIFSNRSMYMNLITGRNTPVFAKHTYRFGFRMLTLGWSDGSTFLPVNGILLSTENEKNRINEAANVDKRTVGYKRRKLSMEKGTSVMLSLLEAAKKAVIPANMFSSTAGFPLQVHFML